MSRNKGNDPKPEPLRPSDKPGKPYPQPTPTEGSKKPHEAPKP